jgi:hypothetical protein
MGGPRARGRCLCGGISFEVLGALRDVVDCHCHRCRRFTGHHMAATAVDSAGLRIHDGEVLLRWFSPAAEVEYGFCGRCGSSLFWRATAAPERTSICAGTLDPPTGLTTACAWWVSEASDYHPRPDLPELARE